MGNKLRRMFRSQWFWIFLAWGITWSPLIVREAWPTDWNIKPCLWESVDSMKLRLYYQSGGIADSVLDTSAARGNSQCYDTVLSIDAATRYYAVITVHDGVDSAWWVWYWNPTGAASVGPEVASAVAETLATRHGEGWWTPGGPGSDTVVIWSYDTTKSGSDSVISNVKITIRDSVTSEPAAGILSTINGYRTFTLDSGTYYNIYGMRTGYIFDVKGFRPLGDSTFSIEGYPISVSQPQDPTTITVEGYITRIVGLMDLEGVQVCAYHQKSAGKYAVDTTGGSKIILPLAGCSGVDTLGHWSIPLIKSSEFTDITQGSYTFQATFNGEPMWKVESMYLTGNINLGDSMAVR